VGQRRADRFGSAVLFPDRRKKATGVAMKY
jgi:hypothetical protein